MSEPANRGSGKSLSASQEFLVHRWEEHLKDDFETRNTEETLKTMVEDAYVNHIPVMTGGVG
jgi:carboxymethylenebutenolidase